ncbi:DNA repair-scaffolding protein isoform X2 [Alligator mississippiensis]|uniref:DNA repair-scaffolding protein isoform X2 n=1 Tax=Alligator mississippiensis TaxID=8496 RepID=UPI0007115D08|nr:DNA repair-scaffolding protein isoform X2 [Alligator mississippiensis]
MPRRKRKRAWTTEQASFPDETPLEFRKASVRTKVATSSISSAWLRCGDGFQSTSVLQTTECTEKKSRINKHLGSLLTSSEDTLGISISKNSREPADILWSSSDSDLSEDENKTLMPSLHNPKSDGFKGERSYSRRNLLLEDKSSEGEPQFIDWEKDSDSDDDVGRSNGSEKDDSPFDILDEDSYASSLPGEEKGDEPCKQRTSGNDSVVWREPQGKKITSTEISEYSSDSENLEDDQVDMETINLGLTKKLQSNSEMDLGQATGRSASDWLKSAQALLQTPKKQPDKSSRALEDSAKKRKLLRGGLAERLNRLQNRERSAITFWRHECVSDYKNPSDGKSGVLVVKILEVHEECTMQVAICQQLRQFSSDSSLEDAVTHTEPILKVLFTKETAGHLRGGPQDIIHIYPPWQKLILHNENVPVILNTYFSQKVFFREHTEIKDKMHCPEQLLIRRNIVSLAQIFTLNDPRDSAPQQSAVNQIACTNMTTPAMQVHSNPESKLQPLVFNVLHDSLLEVVENQGAAGWKGVQVRVVIQRVYYLPAREGFRCQPPGNSSVLPTPFLSSDGPNVRLCLLVQDVYGIFSEVQFLVPCSTDGIEQNSRRWEGKSYCLARMKILQRTTRGRALGLFSLIDSLWPPLVPLKVPGQSQDCEAATTKLPPPSFCYILTAQPDQMHVDVNEEEQISNLYMPPAVHGLREVLQVGGFNQRCSFWAQVIYQRLQVKYNVPATQREFWLFVTDPTLQTGVEKSCKLPKTVPVSVTASCVLDKEVMDALTSTSHHILFFKDALQGNGRIICVECTVLLLQKPLLCLAAGADLSELTGPVGLDELDSTTQADSICIVRGTITGVNEGTAFSWPTCNRCGNGKLEYYPPDREMLYCSLCSQAIISPVLKMQLEVFLHCPSRPQCMVKVKLLQKTIFSILMCSSSEDESYEVKRVLGKEVGLLSCYVQTVTSHPSCIALEEIVLLEPGRN